MTTICRVEDGYEFKSVPYEIIPEGNIVDFEIT